MQIQPILGYFGLFWGYISHLPPPLWISAPPPFLHILDPPLLHDYLHEIASVFSYIDICHQLLDLYSSGQQKGGPIPSTPPKAGKKKVSHLSI